MLCVELIRQALEELHAEDELLELGGIHLAAQNVGGLEQKGFKLGEGSFFFFHLIVFPYALDTADDADLPRLRLWIASFSQFVLKSLAAFFLKPLDKPKLND